MPLAAQTFPPELAGVPYEGSATVLVTLIDYAYLPYSIPDPPFTDTPYYGSVSGDGDTLEVTLQCMMRKSTGRCIVPGPVEYRGGKVFVWNAEAQCYLQVSHRADGRFDFDAWVPLMGGGFWYQGCLELDPVHPPYRYVISGACPLLIYDVSGVGPGPDPRLKEEQSHE